MIMSTIEQKLSKWSSCDVADGLSKLGHKHGGFLDNLNLFSPGPKDEEGAKLVGQAFTVKFAAKEDTMSPKLTGNYIDIVPEGSVIFISQPEPHINAVYGGLMSLRAQILGSRGVVIDGRVRDVREHRELGFPVFAKGLGTTAGGAVCFPTATQVPCKFSSAHQDVWVNPGDYFVADIDGVVLIPRDLVEKVLEVVPTIVEADQRCATAIKGGATVQQAFQQFRGK